MAKGIAEALVNTAAGLFVAVPALIAYNYFLSKVNFFAQNMQYLAQEIISAKLYKEPQRPENTFAAVEDLISAGKL